MASNAGKYIDRSLAFRAAGRCEHENTRTSTLECLTQEKPPATPEAMRKWRKSAQLEPGKIVLHPGQHGCRVARDFRHGRRNDYGISADTLLKASNKNSQFHSIVQAHLEKNYISSIREPLGRSMSRGHVLPQHTQMRNFAFGTSTNLSESAGTLIYPPALEDELKVRENHDKYVKTHGDYYPGEQKKRDYNWSAHNVDPVNDRFGYVIQKEAPENPSLDARYNTVILQKRIQDFKASKIDELGMTKNMGFGRMKSVPADHAFGVKYTDEKFRVRDCISSGYDTNVLDLSVGRIVTASKLRAKQKAAEDRHDPQRSFGVPTVRTDIRRPRVRKVTSNQNFGDDATAKQLLNPNQYSEGGVAEQDFLNKVRRDEMQRIAAKPEYGLAGDLFEECWEKALTYSSTGDVSYATFSRAVDELGY